MIPEGMHDVLPPETAELRAIENALCRRFEAYGYGEVRTPWLEFAETLEAAEDDTLEAGYRIYDQQGHELMLRTDMTVPVARLAASSYRDKPLPLRFFYVAPSIRPWAPQRSQDGEFEQAGAELLGLSSATADAECVTLLCDALAGLGLKDYRVSLGTVPSTRRSSTRSACRPRSARRSSRRWPTRTTRCSRASPTTPRPDEAALKALWRTLELSGTRDGLSQARKLATSDAMEDAIQHLVEVRDLVDDAGFGDAVTFDFGLFQDLTYYSGVIFEAYAPGVGLPIASGGRYDGLLRRFDWDIPGVGFAISLDRLHDALEEAGVVPAAVPACLTFVGGLEHPEHAMELRRAGWAVCALREGVSPKARPWLVREGNSYSLELAEGAAASGSWKDVLRALERA